MELASQLILLLLNMSCEHISKAKEGEQKKDKAYTIKTKQCLKLP